jgi:transitional endoplasmic reticulum ATPase
MPSGDKQIAALRAALAVSPDNIPLRLHLAETLHAQNLPQEAIAEYQTIVRLAPDSAAAHAALGTLFYEQNQIQAALPYLQRAIELNPKDAPTLVTLSRVESALGMLAESLMHLGAARTYDPSMPIETPAAPIEKLALSDRAQTADRDVVSSERAGITFEDVGGLEPIKEKVRLTIIYPFERPELYAAYGKKAGGGILLFGPPGCGKTLLARATAGEVKAAFIYIGISDVLDMYYGESERKLHALFEDARRKTPAVLFFDEVEAIGGKRIDMRQHFIRTLVNQFLSEMDGASGNNEQLLIIGATNSPWHMDGALLRPGRFDRIIFVPPPDYEARLTILRLHLRGKPTADLDLPRLARQTEGYSGADLMGLVEQAAEAALQDALRSNQVRPLTTNDLVRAQQNQRPSMEEWFATARNYGLYANEGGLYNDVMNYMKSRKKR